jgi:hypothetical protein
LKTLLSDEPAVDVAATMVAAIEAIHDTKAREQADARARWKRHVAAADGKLPQAAVAEVLQDSTLLGYSSEDFAADVHAVIEDARLATGIDAEQATMSRLSDDVAKVRADFDRLHADYVRERSERDSIVNAMDADLTRRRRDLERLEVETQRCALRLQRANDEQVKHRSKITRQRIFG